MAVYDPKDQSESKPELFYFHPKNKVLFFFSIDAIFDQICFVIHGNFTFFRNVLQFHSQ